MYSEEKKKINYCVNCNKYGHVQKKCELSPISNGILSFFILNFDEKQKKELEIYISLKINEKNINEKYIYENNVNLDDINKNIKFLMIQRKHSLGYVEFIRGRYDEKKLNTIDDNNIYPCINYLIEQMNDDEINNIITKNFDDLWNNLWNSNNNKYHNEYILSKNKFNEVKKKYTYNDFLKSKYCFNEWGFPKGRRNQYETDMVCALREFEEETNISEKNICIFDNCNYIRETMVGTNGLEYIHNYFLGLLNSDSIIKKNNNEIGDINIMDISECLNKIRPYHLEKINIIKFLYSIINDFLHL
jgi:hypothetical protein